jgi:hypothetical protein
MWEISCDPCRKQVMKKWPLYSTACYPVPWLATVLREVLQSNSLARESRSPCIFISPYPKNSVWTQKTKYDLDTDLWAWFHVVISALCTEQGSGMFFHLGTVPRLWEKEQDQLCMDISKRQLRQVATGAHRMIQRQSLLIVPTLKMTLFDYMLRVPKTLGGNAATACAFPIPICTLAESLCPTMAQWKGVA